ncbi:MAG TPA: BrnT family toxin [Thermoanaerobaculia bacterium]|nr:BrnT family toxin [Thermoanaerobaculia bacterium]
MEFEWDPRKSRINLLKHGVDFAEAMTIFGDPFELARIDPEHSKGEYRFLSLGLSTASRLLLVSYAERDNRIRLISAREAAPHERRQYETRRA